MGIRYSKHNHNSTIGKGWGIRYIPFPFPYMTMMYFGNTLLRTRNILIRCLQTAFGSNKRNYIWVDMTSLGSIFANFQGSVLKWKKKEKMNIEFLWYGFLNRTNNIKVKMISTIMCQIMYETSFPFNSFYAQIE